MSDETAASQPFKRRARYAGKNPRKFEEKYKELDPERYAETVEKVLESGKTPAGQHRPIMVNEILELLDVRPGQRCVDCTLGYGGHSQRLLEAVQPGGVLLAMDQDPLEIVKTEARLRKLGFEAASLIVKRSNFAGLSASMAELGWVEGADAILADLGLSSMQIDNPDRGFTYKHNGPLDMRMNPQRGLTAKELIARTKAHKLQEWLREYSDEPHAERIANGIAGGGFRDTKTLQQTILNCLPTTLDEEEREKSVRRVFQAIRIQVNEEFTALDAWLRQLPDCLKSGGRVAVLTFHSGEDRRVKKAFQALFRNGTFSAINREVVRAGTEERRDNPRASSAKLRWAIRT